MTLEDLEIIFNYDLDSIPGLVKSLREKGVSKELIKSVFDDEEKDLKDKEALKLQYFEFMDHCISGEEGAIKYFIRAHNTQNVTYFYGLKKLLKLSFKNEPANTKFFSPLLYAVFYDQGAVVEQLVKHNLVNGFSSLKEPPGAFIDDEDEEDELGIASDVWYTNAENEVFAL